MKSERDNAFTEVINKVALIINDDKRVMSIISTETNAHETTICMDIIHVKEKIKLYNVIQKLLISITFLKKT